MRVRRISLLQKDVLGPGIRVGVWFQGCRLRCKGCIVPELWNTDEGDLFTPRELFERINSFGIKEVSLSGGEPFEQDKTELFELLRLLRDGGFGIWVYTGYTVEELIDRGFYEHIHLIDVLVDGRYIEELDDGKPWRGSSNQRILLLSDRYIEVNIPQKRYIQIEVSDKDITIFGIASKSYFENLKTHLREKGILLDTMKRHRKIRKSYI